MINIMYVLVLIFNKMVVLLGGQSPCVYHTCMQRLKNRDPPQEYCPALLRQGLLLAWNSAFRLEELASGLEGFSCVPSASRC